jgi:CRP/FNR family cyclic AMP-dependent transcriptional regulator
VRHYGGGVRIHGDSAAKGFWNLLSGTERSALTALGSARDFRPGATMCHEGEPATHLYVLVSGWVKILSVTAEGQERVHALRGNGDVVGEMAGEISGEMAGHRTATLQAVDPVHALIVRYDRFNTFLDGNPHAARAYRRAITQRLRDTVAQLSRQSVTSGAQRLALHLLELAERHGTEADGVVDVIMPLSQEELASLAGASRATVTRAFGNWRKRGIVRTAPKHVTITDLASLRQIANYRD